MRSIASYDTRRWLRRGLAAFALVMLLTAAALAAALNALEAAWLKPRIQAQLLAASGLELDYRALKVSALSGVELRDLVVRSPGPVRAFAPEFARIGRVALRWSLRSLIAGEGPYLERAEISDVALNVVVDEHGKSTLDWLSSSPPSAASSPSQPLSHLPGRLLAQRRPVAELALRQLAVAVIRTRAGSIVDRTQLRGLSLSLRTRDAGQGAFRVDAALGTAGQPLELALTRAADGGAPATARMQLWAAAGAAGADVQTELELRMREQNFVSSVSAQRWLHAQAALHFEPAAGKTTLRLERVEAGDGVVDIAAALELPDDGTPSVDHARADLDLARLLGWLPPGLVPIRAERARVHAELAGLALAKTMRLAPNRVAALDAEIAQFALQAPLVPLEVYAAKLALRARQPEAGGIAAQGSLSVQRARLPELASIEDVSCNFDAAQAPDATLTAKIDTRFKQLDHAQLHAHTGQIELHANALQLDPAAPSGEVALAVALAALEVDAPAAHTCIRDLSAHAHTALTGHAPYAADLTASAKRAFVADGGGRVLADSAAELKLEARELEPNRDRPLQSRGTLQLALDTPDVHAALRASQRDGALDYTLETSAHSLQSARPFLPPALYQDAWDRTALTLHASGHVAHLYTPSLALQQQAELKLERFTFADVRADALALELQTRGDLLRQHAELSVQTHGLGWGEVLAPDADQLTFSADLDRKQRSLAFELGARGRTRVQLTAALSFDSIERKLVYNVSAQLAQLAPFAHLSRAFDAFDLSKLELDLHTRGTLHGVISAVGSDGSFALERELTRTAAIDGALDLELAHLDWNRGALGVVAPDLRWHVELAGNAARRTLSSQLEVPTLHVGFGEHVIDLNGVRDTATAALSGDLAKPETELQQRLDVRAVEQTVLPEYALGELSVELTADHAPNGALHIAQLTAANGAGGTSLSLSGNVDLSDGRRSLSLSANLGQDLARLSTIRERLEARGKLQIDANLNSADLAHYRLRASVKGEDLNLKRKGYELEGATGEVPITLAFVVGPQGVEIERTEQRNPYSMLRFADQLPLLRRSGFISIARLKTPFVAIAPLVGNLEIEQNLIALRQFEMGVRGGTITGQSGLDWDGAKSTLELHVRASGVQSTHGEPFDGNIAVAISAADRTIDGRAEILRIGERHLLDLLDLQDPLHTDPAMNRIRSALDFGYPESLRLVFDRGFASARLTLGGLASLVSISELRGLPMGPIVDRMLAQMRAGSDLKEMP